MKISKGLFTISVVGIVFLIMVTGCKTNQEKLLEEDPLDMLWLSDSSGWEVPDIYAGYIAEDNDVEVNVTANYTFSVGEILHGLQGQESDHFLLSKLPEKIAESEVIVIYGNPTDSINPSNPWDWNCGTSTFEGCYVNNCEMDSFSQYISDLKEIYSIIYEIRKGKPTLIRAIDAYNPHLQSHCLPDGVLDECIACWENYNAAIHQAADEMGVPIAHVFDAWNGTDHTENPVEKGYTEEDNEHPSVLGATVTAQLLRELGYEPIVP